MSKENGHNIKPDRISSPSPPDRILVVETIEKGIFIIDQTPESPRSQIIEAIEKIKVGQTTTYTDLTTGKPFIVKLHGR